MEASISLKSVSKKINQDILLADLSFGIEKGSKFAIVGPNKSGKSSIIKIISGLMYRDKGTIYVQGMDVNRHPLDTKRIIGYMPQSIDFDNHLTLLDNISIYGELYGLSSNKSKKETLRLAEYFNMNDYINEYPNNIPKFILRLGMFARSLVHNPEILLLDEPTLNLDIEYRKIVWEYILNFCNDKTVLYATQNIMEAEQFSNRIAILNNGVIKFIGSYDYLIENSNNLSMFTIKCKHMINDDIVKSLSLNPKIIKLNVLNNQLSFYSADKKEFYMILKELIKLEIIDLNTNKYSLQDILLDIKSGNKK